MAKTNTTRRVIQRQGVDYEIYTVNSNSKTAINDTTVNADNEIIIAGDNVANQPIRYTNLVAIDGNSSTSPTAIKNYKRGTSHYQNGLEFLAGCRISNVTIESSGCVRCSVNTTTPVVLRNVRFLMLPNAGTASQRNNTLFYFRFCALDIDGVVVEGGSCALDAAKFVRFDNYSPRNMNEGFMTVTGRGTDAPHFLRLNSFNPVGCTKDFAFLTSSKYVFYGYPDKVPTGSVHFDHDRVTQTSSATIRKELFLSLLDSETKAPILGAKSQVLKLSHDIVTYSDPQFTITAAGTRATQAYKNTITATSEGILEYDFPLAYVAVGAGENIGRSSAPRTVAYFTKNNSKEYAHDIELRAYGYQTKILPDFSLIGLDPIVKTEFLQVDENITQRDAAVVAAYTTVSNLDELYDVVSHYNSVNLDVPQLFEVQGTTLVLRDGYNFTLLSALHRQVAFAARPDGTTTLEIRVTGGTLSAGTKLKSLLIAGPVRTGPQVSITAPYFDSESDSIGTIILGGSLDGVTVHYNARDADRGSNPISTGTTFRYLASRFAGLTLFLRGTNSNSPDDEVILAQVIPPGTGSHILGNLGFGEDAQLRSIQNIVRILEDQNSGITRLGNDLATQNTGIAGLGNTLQRQNTGIAELGEDLRTQNNINLAAIQNNANRIEEAQFTDLSVIYTDRSVSDHSSPNTVIAVIAGNGTDLDITRTAGSDTDNILIQYDIPDEDTLTLGDLSNEFNEFILRLYNKSDTTQNLSITAVFQGIFGSTATELARKTAGVTLIGNSVNNENTIFEFHNVEDSVHINRVVLLIRGLDINKMVSISSYGAYRRTIKQSTAIAPVTPINTGFSDNERSYILETLGVLDAETVGTLKAIQVETVIPTYSLSGVGFTKTQRLSNIYIRGNGTLHDNAATLTRPVSVTLGSGAADADEYSLLIRNTGGDAENITFEVQMLFQGTIVNRDTQAASLDAQGDLEELNFKYHNTDTETQIDEIRWVITGLTGGIAIESEGFYKRELKMVSGSVTIDQDALVAAISADAMDGANVLLSTTIATVTDQTHLILATGSSFNNYANQIIKITSASNDKNQGYVAINSFSSISKEIILKQPLPFVVADGDKVKILIRDTGKLAVTIGLDDDSNFG